MLGQINPFDILSGKVVQNEHGTFWFKQAGHNLKSNGRPITENLHREGGPACAWSDKNGGGESWYENGLDHREDGPAYTSKYIKEWFKHGKKHNLNGPAVMLSDGSKGWFIENIQYSETGYNKEISRLRQEWQLYNKC